MTPIFHIHYSGDLFEISLRGPVIARITCYVGGHFRQDVQFDDCPDPVKEKILDKVEEALKNND